MPLFRILFMVFLLVPIIEIYLLIEVGGIIGPWATIFLVVATAVIGAALLRMQGLSTMMRMRRQMEKGEIPAMPMLEGVLLLLAGALLLTPGFFTDTVGFLLLVPPLRQYLIKSLILNGVFRANWFHASSANSGTRSGTGSEPPSERGSEQVERPPVTLEGEYKRKDD